MKRNFKYFLFPIFFLCLLWACKKDDKIIEEAKLPEDVAEVAAWYSRQLMPNENPQAFANLNKPDWQGTVIKQKGDSTVYITKIYEKDVIIRELQVTSFDGSYTGLVRQYDYIRKDSTAVGTFTINGRMLDIGYFDANSK